MSEEKKDEKRRVASVVPSRFKAAEYQRQIYVVNPELGTMPEDLLRPEYWAHVGQQLKPFDRIEARAEDGGWFAEYLVVTAGRGFAQLSLLMSKSLEEAVDMPVGSSAYKVEWAGPQHQYRVRRLSDNQVLKHGCQSKAEAERWLGEHVKAMAA